MFKVQPQNLQCTRIMYQVLGFFRQSVQVRVFLLMHVSYLCMNAMLVARQNADVGRFTSIAFFKRLDETELI